VQGPKRVVLLIKYSTFLLVVFLTPPLTPSYYISLFSSLEWEMFQTEVVENIKTRILCSVTFLENHAVCEVMWKNIVEPGRPHMTIWRMRFGCWITKATDIHSGYVILIVFPLQQWSQERALMLLYTFSACFVITAQNMKILVCGRK
jgi:hypothetical protein